MLFLVSSAKTPGLQLHLVAPQQLDTPEKHFITSPWEERHAHTETSPGNRRILLRVATATSEVVREERRSRRMDGWTDAEEEETHTTNQ